LDLGLKFYWISKRMTMIMMINKLSVVLRKVWIIFWIQIRLVSQVNHFLPLHSVIHLRINKWKDFQSRTHYRAYRTRRSSRRQKFKNSFQRQSSVNKYPNAKSWNKNFQMRMLDKNRNKMARIIKILILYWLMLKLHNKIQGSWVCYSSIKVYLLLLKARKISTNKLKIR